jgi:hypothetical protein
LSIVFDSLADCDTSVLEKGLRGREMVSRWKKGKKKMEQESTFCNGAASPIFKLLSPFSREAEAAEGTTDVELVSETRESSGRREGILVRLEGVVERCTQR